MVEKLTPRARPVLLVAAALLFVDLFLNWHDASLRVVAHAEIDGGNAWSGWGAVVGILVVALIALEFAALAGRLAASPLLAGVSAALALGVALFTLVEAFAGGADVPGPDALVETETRWPAYVGIGLAIVIAVAAGLRLRAETAVAARPAAPTTL